MYLRQIRANFTNNSVDYYAINLVKNISNTHRVYIASVAELILIAVAIITYLLLRTTGLRTRRRSTETG
jgi:hypothetical protein